MAALAMGTPAIAHDSNCDNSATDGSPIHCEKDSTSTDDISIDVDGIDIDTTADGDAGRGIAAIHEGSGNITIDIAGTTTGETTTASTIDTTGTGPHATGSAHAVAARHTGTGTSKTKITVENTEITTSGRHSRGISAEHNGSGVGGTGNNSMQIRLNSGTSITTGGERGYGVFGSLITDLGDLDVDLQNGSSITTQGTNAWAVYLLHPLAAGNGNILLDLTGTTIETQGTAMTGNVDAHGIFVHHAGTGNMVIRAPTNGGSIVTHGQRSRGIYARHDSSGNINIDLTNLEITTQSTSASASAYGIFAWQRGNGNTDIDARGGFIKTKGGISRGIYAVHFGKSSSHEVFGDIDVATHRDHAITTTGAPFGDGIVTYHYGTADTDRQIKVTVGGTINVSGANAQGVRVGTVSSAGVPSRMASLRDDGYRRQTVTVNNQITSAGEGVFLANGGRVTIGPQGSISSTKGIAILATGTVPEDSSDPNNVIAAIPPKLRVDLNLGGRQVSQALGDGWIINDGGQTTIAVNNVVLHDGVEGVTGRTAPNGVWNVRMRAEGVNVANYTDDEDTMDIDESDPMHWTKEDLGNVPADRDFSVSDFTEARRPTPPPPEPEPEMMEVNEAVVAGEDMVAAVQVEGDGTVRIGAQGSLRAVSGIAILATRDTPGDTPELTVDLDLDGRSVDDVIGDDWIINDGGGTNIVVNGVMLHDATTGVVPDAVAPNGAFNTRVNDEVRIRAEGVRVTDRTDPDNWTITEPGVGVIADRDFSVADFIETAAGAMPRPPMMIEEYAPRAAVYEALPSVLLGLQERTPAAPRPRQPTWITVTGHTGSQDFERSTVGVEYDIDAVQIEAGKHFTFNNGTEAWATLQHLDGTADVDSPFQGGDIDVQGLNISLELCRGCKDGDKYVSGKVSLGRYDLGLDSDTRGTLKQGVGATAYTLALEAGRRLQKTAYTLIPRLRLEHASVSIDRFTDAVDARVSYPDADRSAIALGVRAETSPNPERKDGLSLWGLLDLEHRLDDAQTTARVSGARLKAESGDNSVLLGLGGTWQRDRLRLNAGLSAREGLGTGSESYGATLDLALQF